MNFSAQADRASLRYAAHFMAWLRSKATIQTTVPRICTRDSNQFHFSSNFNLPEG